MAERNKTKLKLIEAKKLSDLNKQQTVLLQNILLNHISDNSNKIKTNVKNRLIQQIKNSKTTRKLKTIETKYITPLRFIKSDKPLPLTTINKFNIPLSATVSKAQKIKRNHVGLKLIKEGVKHSRAFNNMVRVNKYLIISLGSNVAVDIYKIVISSYKKAILELDKNQNFKFYSIMTLFRKYELDGVEMVAAIPVNSGTFDKKNWIKWLLRFVNDIEKLIQSDKSILILGSIIQYGFILTPSGGCYVEDKNLNDILKRKTIITIKNKDNNCFWYALLASYNIGNSKNKVNAYNKPNIINQAKELCINCNCEFDKPVNFTEIAGIEEKLNTNIYILDIRDLPIIKANINLYNHLIYKSENKHNGEHWLLYDNINSHFHVITDIRKFFNSKYYCNECCRCFKSENTYDMHFAYMCSKLSERKIQPVNNCKRLAKECKNYMYGDIIKGSDEEINYKLSTTTKSIDVIEDSIKHPKYIIFDFETDTSKKIYDDGSVLLHQVMHVEADIIKVSNNHIYEDSLIDKISFTGYDSCDNFCKWLFDKQNKDCTIMAHNGAGYDNKFILKWCIEHGLNPSMIIRQGSRITYMHFKKFNIRFVDTLNFFNEGLRKLPAIFGIKETVKGYFPHHFNTVENQNYIGVIPDIKYFGVDNMKVEDILVFNEWYNEQINIKNWSFKDEMIKYCRADVEVLSRSVLAFRKDFYDNLNIDPFRYITLPSLCMNIFKSRFLPYKSLVANDANKPINKLASEWFINLNNPYIQREKTLFINQSELPKFDKHKNKIIKYKNDQPLECEEYFKDSCRLCPDGYDNLDETIYEFYGCKFHGCQKCYKQGKNLYNSTMERENILKAAGYKIISIWECEWFEIKKNMSNEEQIKIECQADREHINIRDCLFGGRTEAFKSYYKCKEDEEGYYFDVVSLYPTVNALDNYPIGFKQSYNPTVEEILNESFIGVVKCDVIPPKNLFVPVLPESKDGKLLFHLNPMSGTWCSVELKKAIELGYIISNIHAGFKYKVINGLMKKYVEYFLKIKTCNSGVKSDAECNALNKSHEALGLNIHITSVETMHNPGKKNNAKLCLNALWGKFGMRANLDSFNYYGENEVGQFTQKILDSRYIIKEWEIINSNCVELKYSDTDDSNIEASYISEITAAFTTANARMRLYDLLSWLHPSQILYCDTDSVMFIYNKNNKLHKFPSNNANDLPKSVKFGKGLGEWEDENRYGEFIDEFVCGGAKSYSYRTNLNKVVIKQKGITMDAANAKIITFENIRDMVLNNTSIKSEERFTFRWDKVSKDVVTKFIGRSIKSTVNSKRDLDGYNTLPFGFEV